MSEPNAMIARRIKLIRELDKVSNWDSVVVSGDNVRYLVGLCKQAAMELTEPDLPWRFKAAEAMELAAEMLREGKYG